MCSLKPFIFIFLASWSGPLCMALGSVHYLRTCCLDGPNLLFPPSSVYLFLGFFLLRSYLISTPLVLHICSWLCTVPGSSDLEVCLFGAFFAITWFLALYFVSFSFHKFFTSFSLGITTAFLNMQLPLICPELRFILSCIALLYVLLVFTFHSFRGILHSAVPLLLSPNLMQLLVM